MKNRIWNSMLFALAVFSLLAVAFAVEQANAQVVVAVPPVVEEVVVHRVMSPIVVSADQVPVTAYHPVVTPAGTVVYSPVTVYRPAASAVAKIVVPSRPVVTTYSPVVTTYSPVVTTYRPVVVYHGVPVVVHPKVYVAGQPVRNLLRAITP